MKRGSVPQKSGAKRGFATVSMKNLEADGVEIGAEECARLVARGSAKNREKRFLGEFLGVSRIEDAAAKEAEKRLFVPGKKFRERIRRTLREEQHELLVARWACRGVLLWSGRRLVHNGSRRSLRI